MASLAADVDEYRIALRAWLCEHRDELTYAHPANCHQHIANGLALTNTLWRAGWKQVGWPSILGGLGGGPRHRATYYDELCHAGIEIPDTDLSIEVIGPALLHYAPDMAAEYLPRLLAGEEAWAQAYSEPEAGSDLASLRTRGVIRGDEVIVDGLKMWTRHGHLAARLLTLVRTDGMAGRHRGLAALLIDTNTPGLTRRPLIFASGVDEMCETFFDNVKVPVGRIIGGPDQGWAVAMLMLQYERGIAVAQRQAWLGLRLRQLASYLDQAGISEVDEAAIGTAWLQLQTVRARAIENVARLDTGSAVAAEASPDKVLLARAEQSIFEVARVAERSGFAFDDAAEDWRVGWWYSRATSILSGAGEKERSNLRRQDSVPARRRQRAPLLVAEIGTLLRDSLRQVLAESTDEIGAALAEFDWQDLVLTDEAFAFTVLFEEHGYLAADTNALDIAIATVLGCDGRAPVLWPVDQHVHAGDLGGSGVVVVDGVAMGRQPSVPNNILAPVYGRLQMIAVSSVEERMLGGMARGSAWRHWRVWGTPTTDFGPWSAIEAYARLAIASELVGLADRISDVAAEQVNSRRHFVRPIAATRAMRLRLAEAYVEIVGAKALISAAWQDRQPAGARWAKAVAGSAFDAVAKEAIQVCGAAGLGEEHPLPALVRRGMTLDGLLGSASVQQLSIGRDVIVHQRDTRSSTQLDALAVGRF